MREFFDMIVKNIAISLRRNVTTPCCVAQTQFHEKMRNELPPNLKTLKKSKRVAFANLGINV
jgi:hypothetical protein